MVNIKIDSKIWAVHFLRFGASDFAVQSGNVDGEARSPMWKQVALAGLPVVPGVG